MIVPQIELPIERRYVKMKTIGYLCYAFGVIAESNKGDHSLLERKRSSTEQWVCLRMALACAHLCSMGLRSGE